MRTSSLIPGTVRGEADPQWFNTDNIERIEPLASGCRLHLVSGDKLDMADSAHELLNRTLTPMSEHVNHEAQRSARRAKTAS